MTDYVFGGSAAVFTNMKIREKREVAFSAASVLRDCGLKVRLPEFRGEGTAAMPSGPGYEFREKSELFEDISVAVVIGGDGTILDAAKYLSGTGIPIIGINMGRVGYMTEIEPDELPLIRKLLSGEGRTERRSTLALSVDGETKESLTALNDIVVTNSTASQVIDISISENGSPAGRYRADGIIFSTATGSTAYNLAAGGPVVDPRLSCIVVTPICPHTFFSRPNVFPGESKLDVSLEGFRGQSVHIILDGRLCEKAGRKNRLTVTVSDKTVDFLRIKPMKFYQTLHRTNEC